MLQLRATLGLCPKQAQGKWPGSLARVGWCEWAGVPQPLKWSVQSQRGPGRGMLPVLPSSPWRAERVLKKGKRDRHRKFVHPPVNRPSVQLTGLHVTGAGCPSLSASPQVSGTPARPTLTPCLPAAHPASQAMQLYTCAHTFKHTCMLMCSVPPIYTQNSVDILAHPQSHT